MRLAQYRPFANDGLSGHAVLTDLVLAAALEGDGNVPSLRDCQETCKALWGLDVEIDELREIVDELLAGGQLERANGHFTISETSGSELARRLQESGRLESRAFEDWEASLRTLNAGLTDDDVHNLREDLDAWLQRLIARHGVESALILYPEVPRAQELFEQIERNGIDFLPAREGRVGEIREQALFLFVRQPTEAQRILLANLLNTAYFLTVFSLDTEGGRLVQELTRGQRVYLDTNFVYRVLNLQGPRNFLSARRLLEMTQTLGYKTAVTPWTVAELKYSLERARTFLMSRPIPPGELADLAASATTDENFVTAYWRRIKEKPVSPKDFFEFYAQIEDQLAQHGIEVVDEGCRAVDANKNAINEQLGVIERALGPYDRPDPVKEHDVKHRLLVERLRGDSNRGFATAGYWFLTCDSLLPRYDRAAAEAAGTLPFCASSSAWFQVMRSFTPRTEDFDQTLSDLLASPYIRYRGRIGYKVVEEVVGRIDLYKGNTPQLAAKVLLDTALLREVAAEPETARRQELIDNAIVAAAEETQRQLQESQAREGAERLARRKAEETSGEAAAALVAERRAREALEEKLECERRDREEEKLRIAVQFEETRLKQEQSVKTLGHQVKDQATELRTLKKQLETRSKRMRSALVVLAAVLILAGTIVPLVVGTVSGAWPVTLFLLGGLAVAGGVLGFAFGHQRVWGAVIVLGVVLGIVVAVHEIAANHRTGIPSSPAQTSP